MKKFLSITERDLGVIKRLNMRSIHTWIATWFGCGFLRPAPGTWGSLGALPFGIALCMSGNLILMIAAIVVVTYIGTKSTAVFSEMTQTHDCKMVVVDEVAGQWIAMLPIIVFMLPPETMPLYVLVSFVLFRFFDILKPWPCGYIDKKMSSPFGVMLDDILAGIYAACILSGVLLYAGFS